MCSPCRWSRSGRSCSTASSSAPGPAEMRNGMALALIVFLIAAWALMPILGNHGLWLALLVRVRAVLARPVLLAARARPGPGSRRRSSRAAAVGPAGRGRASGRGGDPRMATVGRAERDPRHARDRGARGPLRGPAPPLRELLAVCAGARALETGFWSICPPRLRLRRCPALPRLYFNDGPDLFEWNPSAAGARRRSRRRSACAKPGTAAGAWIPSSIGRSPIGCCRR